MADGKVVISTALDNSGIEKEAGKLKNSVSGAVKGVRGTLGGLAKVVAGVTATITAAFGAAAVAITKQAVDAYADYEQLIGGVETLFKDAADKVAGYAEDAFYTVGISANEYMETVTSFSASLISSLAGDTVKAADVANMALTDMADNANKMGTPLESIKTAYQGFAKQNYTMLDNLKLGYGGTKTEMERLLKDAHKLTGVKYNINNLADVYNAIHAIQGEMGISARTAEDVAEIYKNTGREVSETIGTTAKEAEKTITGSANMTKAAWKNVLAAIAGGGDLDKAINNLVYSVSKYFDNIVPVVERSLAGIGELIEKVAPQLVETVAAALIKAIPSLLNAVYQMIIGLANGIYEGIVTLFSGSTKDIVAQLNATDDLADGYNAAADGASNLANATEEAGKAAKKHLAPFDEITKLGSKDSNTEAGSALGGIVSGGAPSTDGAVDGNALAAPLIAALQVIRDKFKELIEPLKNIDFKPAMGAIEDLGDSFLDLGDDIVKALGWAWFELLVPLSKWTIEEATPAALDVLSAAFDALDEAMGPVLDGLADLWEDLDPFVVFVEETVIQALASLRGMFDELANTISDRGEEIREIFSGIGEIFDIVWRGMEPILTAMRTKWRDTFDAISSYVVDRFGFIIDFLHGIVEFIAGVLTLDFGRAWEGLVEMVKAPLNSLIGYVNTMISAVVAGVNAIIDMVNTLHFDVPDWVPGIGGSTFGFSFSQVIAPQIPYLAKGAVLPPNKPFMAVVGDQTHGTNVEAPLSTIEEAVANVLGDMLPAMIAGFERVIEEQQATRRAVESIEVGDTTIGEAANRHNAKIAVITGGA